MSTQEIEARQQRIRALRIDDAKRRLRLSALTRDRAAEADAVTDVLRLLGHKVEAFDNERRWSIDGNPVIAIGADWYCAGRSFSDVLGAAAATRVDAGWYAARSKEVEQ